jgi:rod shape-determining protein MreD
MRYPIAVIFAWAFAVLDVSAMPYLHPLGVSPDLVLIFAVCWAIVRGHDEAMIVIPICAVMQDLTTSDPVGTSLLGLAPIVPLAVAVRLRAVESDFLPAVATVMGASVCFGVMSMMVLGATGQEIAVFHALFRVVLPSIVINALFTPLIFLPMHWISPAAPAWLQGSTRLRSSI